MRAPRRRPARSRGAAPRATGDGSAAARRGRDHSRSCPPGRNSPASTSPRVGERARASRRDAVLADAEAALRRRRPGTGRASARSGRPGRPAAARSGCGEDRPGARAGARRRGRRGAARRPRPPRGGSTPVDPDLDRAAVAAERVDGGRGVAVGPGRDLVRAQRPQVAQQVVHTVGAARAPSVGEPLQLQLHLVERRRDPAARGGPRRRAAPAAGRGRATSAAARRSASGASPSYMNTAIQANSSERANGDAWSVSTAATRTRRARTSVISWRSAGTSKWSRRHSRVASSRIGKSGWFDAAASRSALRWRCCHSGVRSPGRRRGSRSARAAASRKTDEKSAVPGSTATTASSISSGSKSRSSVGIDSTASGRRSTMPSSDHRTWAPGPNRSASRASIASAHGACTRDAERRQDADAPVAELVAEALDHDRAVVGHRGGLGLLGDVGDEVVGGERVEPELVAQARRATASRPVEAELAREPADRPAELDRPTRAGRLPEGELPGLAGGRADDDAVTRDVLDPPRRRAQQHHLAAP